MKDYSGITNEKDGDIIFVTVAKYKLFMAYGKIGMDSYCLYSHMMFTARLQETNQIYANDTYLRQGLDWSRERTQKAKNLLFELALIEEITKRDSSGKFSGKYIKVKTKSTPFEISEISQPCVGNPSDGKADCGESTANALTNKLNALTNKEIPSCSNEQVLSRKKQPKQEDTEYIILRDKTREQFNKGFRVLTGGDNIEWDQKQNASLKRLCNKYVKDQNRLDHIIREFYKLKMKKDKLLLFSSFTPSGLVGCKDRLLSYIGGLTESQISDLTYGSDSDKKAVRDLCALN